MQVESTSWTPAAHFDRAQRHSAHAGRSVAIRYEKRAVSYQAKVAIASIAVWLPS